MFFGAVFPFPLVNEVHYDHLCILPHFRKLPGPARLLPALLPV